MMEKTDLLLKTQTLIREATPSISDLLLHAGIERIQRNVLNYYREDLDYPAHSARAIVDLVSSMLSFMDVMSIEDLHGCTLVRSNLRGLLEIWSNEARI